MAIIIDDKMMKIGLGGLIALGLVFGGYRGVKAYQANKANEEALTAQVSDITGQLEVKTGELVTATTDLESANEALTVIKEQYGVALTDKETAEQEASKQKKSAQASAGEASKQKGIATACADNYEAMTNVAYYTDQQAVYWSNATIAVANAGDSYINGYYPTGDASFDEALGYVDR